MEKNMEYHFKFKELVKEREMNLSEVLYIMNMVPEDVMKKMFEYIKFQYNDEKP